MPILHVKTADTPDCASDHHARLCRVDVHALNSIVYSAPLVTFRTKPFLGRWKSQSSPVRFRYPLKRERPPRQNTCGIGQLSAWRLSAHPLYHQRGR